MNRVLLKYALLQIPELVLLVVVLLLLRIWAGLDSSILWWGLVLWLVKDVALYPVYRRVLANPVPTDGVIGASGIALERLAPTGYIRVRGELWRARLREGALPLEVDCHVRVLGMDGLTLEVEAEEGAAEGVKRDD